MPEHDTVSQPAPHETNFDAVIVGAGLAGLYAVHRLRSLGLRVRAFEAGAGIGGTWFWNRYPGARCDIESLEYSYSFSEQLQQEWKWPERYGTQQDILRYLNHVADRFDLRSDIVLNTRVVSAVFDTAASVWQVTTDQGVTVSARFCVMASGNLSTPKLPAFPGLDRFTGQWHHTSRWPAQGVDFSGQRVGIIGTGATGVQLVPHIARQARHLHVFQRTANYSVPAHNSPLDPEKERAHKANYRARRDAARDTAFGVAGYPQPTQSALQVSAQERQRRYEQRWAEGVAFGLLSSYTDLMVNQAANETAAQFVREKIHQTVRDPIVADLLTPRDHPLGSRRLCLDSGYFETFNRDNVTLVDVRKAPIEEVTASGLRTRDARYELDALIFATGFEAMTGALSEIDIRVSDGPALAQCWATGPRAYLGLMIAGIPNLFTVTGPGSPSVKAQMIVAIEQHVNWIADCISHLRAEGVAQIEAEPDAEREWLAHVNEVAAGTLFPLADSWYFSKVPGQTRQFMPYVGGFGRYRQKCEEVAAGGYRGFRLTR